MNIKNNIYKILLASTLILASSCQNDTVEESFNTTTVDNNKSSNRTMEGKENSDSEYIHGVKRFSTNYKEMLFYMTENARSNSVEDLNNTILEYVTNVNPAFVDSSQEITFLKDPNQLNSSSKNLSANLNYITTTYSYSYDDMSSKLKEYIIQLEKEETFNRHEYFNANIMLSLVDYINENENDRFGINTSVTGKSRRACAANVIGAGILGAGLGCWGGVKAGAWFGLQSAAAGCAIGAAFMGISSAFAAYGTNPNC